MSSTCGKKKSASRKVADFNAGHRERLRQRFVLNGFEGMLDYEVMECLLTLVIPRKDVKPLAKTLLAEYETVYSVLSAPLERLEQFKGLGRNSAVGLKMLAEACEYCLLERVQNRNLLKSSAAVKDFVRMKLGVRSRESCMLLLLDASYHLIEQRVISEGTTNYVVNYQRNILEEAINTKRTVFVILVHNHPSGNCHPSPEDITATADIAKSLGMVGIILLDHLIVSRNECFSFLENGIDLDTGRIKSGENYQ